MAKRQSKTVHVTFRLTEAAARAVAFVANECTWSAAKAASWLIDHAAQALNNNDFDAEVMRRELAAWHDRATAQMRADKLIKEANAAVRAITGPRKLPNVETGESLAKTIRRKKPAK